MNVLKILGMPLQALLENVEATVTAGSMANAREAAADTALRSLAYDALRRETQAGALLRYDTPA